jgi:predicted transcriptional regulator
MPLSKESKPKIHETTVRINVEIAHRLAVIAQVLGMSRNGFMNQAITESVLIYEGDPDYQQKLKEWVETLVARIGA